MVAKGVCKLLCLKMFPEMSDMSNAIDFSKMIEPVEVRRLRPNDSMEWSCLKREHNVYAFLAGGLSSSVRNDCLLEAISASSTDNYPEESIRNTLAPGDRVGRRASYWSSKGESDAAVPERLTYHLMAKMCLITEIRVQPFQAFFQFGFPIYSAKSVRFLVGHSTCDMEPKSANESSCARESPLQKYVWTYESPEFVMAQENCLQKFKLPEPVLSVGGVLQVQLLGRVQKQEMDGLYYVCISHVEVVGRPLSSAFDIEMLDPAGKCKLRHYTGHHLFSSCDKTSPQGESSTPSGFDRFSASIRGWEQMIFNTFLEAVPHPDDFEFDD